MAFLVDFEKVSEDRATVVYRFGTRPSLDRSLTIDRTTGQAAPTDGTPDHQFAAALWKIKRGRAELGHWPATGAYAA